MRCGASSIKYWKGDSLFGKVVSKYRPRQDGKLANFFRPVSTWSPLANAFNTKSRPSLVQKLYGKSTGLFGFDELSNANGFWLLRQNVESHCSLLVAEATGTNRKRKMVEIFDELSDTLCKVADMAEFVRNGHPKSDYATAADVACISINELVEKLNTNFDLYKSLKNVSENGDIFATDSVDDHVTKLFLLDFEQSGIHLDEKKRQNVVELTEYISRVGNNFLRNSSLPRTVSKKSLPPHLSKGISGEVVEVTGPIADSKDELFRELAYRVYLQPDKHQTELLDILLSSRHSLADLCGFPSYAHKAIKGSLAKDPQTVKNFLSLLSETLQPKASVDYKEMLKMKISANNNINSQLYPWDVPHFCSALKHQKYQVRSSDYAAYFSLGACMEGLSNLFTALYGVSLQVMETQNGEVWDEDIIKLAVCDENTTLGYIYCDFFERPNKPLQDCHFTIRGGKTLPDGTYQLPVVTLFLNLPDPKWNAPSLLLPGMVDNLFHEMGHAMHSMLGRTKYQHVTGTRCPTDFAEVPSILMEYFASDPRVVSSFARHYSTGEPIPDRLLRDLQDSKRLFGASDIQLQVFYAALDQELHSPHPLGKSTLEVLGNTQNNYYGLPHVTDTAWHLRFGHLVGYGAKYYSYLVSRAVASWIWHQHFEADPFCSRAGHQYRTKVLQHGGGIPPADLVQNYLGTEVSPENLSKALMLDLER